MTDSKPFNETVNFRLCIEKKLILKEIAKMNHRDVSGQMQYLVEKCLAENQLKGKSKNE